MIFTRTPLARPARVAPLLALLAFGCGKDDDTRPGPPEDDTGDGDPGVIPALEGPIINEIFASSLDMSFVDDEGEPDDWIEIVNTSDEEVDMFGWGLNDDGREVAEWKFPVDTRIGPGARLIVWADGDTGNGGALHAAFRLAATGERLQLIDADGILRDDVDFDALEPGESAARFPDTTGGWFVTSHPTPDAANTSAWYTDADGDSYGVGEVRQGGEPAEGEAPRAGDCDDSDGDLHPGKREDCDDIDNDCDGQIDEGTTVTFYADFDIDGYGDPYVWQEVCDEKNVNVPDHLVNAGDCDDGDRTVNPASRAEDDNCLDAADLDCSGFAYCEGQLSDAPLFWSPGIYAPQDRAGSEIALPGDLDGDGEHDVVVDGLNRVTILYGPTFERTHPISGPSPVEQDEGWGDIAFASALSAHDDLTGDGVTDLLISGHETAHGDGAAYVFSGVDPSFSVVSADRVIRGSGTERAGRSLSTGDFDGDGAADVLIGAPDHVSGGRVYLVHGPLGADVALTDAAATWSAAQRGEDVGRTVAGVGDVNDDGVDDMAFTARDGRAAFLVFGGGAGGASAAADADAVIDLGPGVEQAKAVDPAGDLDGDGYAEWLVRPLWNGFTTHHTERSLVYVMPGGTAPPSGTGDAMATVGASGGQFRSFDAVATMADADGDMIPDIAVGHETGKHEGIVFVFSGPVQGALDPMFATRAYQGFQAGDDAGSALASADWTGDGLSDLFVGAEGFGYRPPVGGKQDSIDDCDDCGLIYLLPFPAGP